MNQAQEDFKTFMEADPALKKEQKKEADAAKKQKGELTKEQVKLAGKFTEEMKQQKQEQVEAKEKEELIRKLGDYIAHMKQYYPEKLEALKVPKTFGAKNTLQELRVWVLQAEHELNKTGGLQTLEAAWRHGFAALEKFNSQFDPLGLDLTNLGTAAKFSLEPRQVQTEQGVIVVPGPAKPLLSEFAVKYSSWFSSSVEWRLGLMVVQMVIAVDTANKQGKKMEKPATEESKDAVNNL